MESLGHHSDKEFSHHDGVHQEVHCVSASYEHLGPGRLVIVSGLDGSVGGDSKITRHCVENTNSE